MKERHTAHDVVTGGDVAALGRGVAVVLQQANAKRGEGRAGGATCSSLLGTARAFGVAAADKAPLQGWNRATFDGVGLKATETTG